MRRFQDIIPIVLRYEGGFVNDPKDTGGATNRGITIGTLSKYSGKKATIDDVKNLTENEAITIYHGEYWKPISGDSLPMGVDLIMLDGSVNHGKSVMTSFLIEATNTEKYEDAVKKASTMDKSKLIFALSNLRRSRYVSRPNFATYGEGWLRRLKEVTNSSLAYVNPLLAKVEQPKYETGSVAENLAPRVDEKLSNETIQKLLAADKLYLGKIDGIIGSKSFASIDKILAKEIGVVIYAWKPERKLIAIGQYYAKRHGIEVGELDGFYGQQTQQAFGELNYKLINDETMPKWRDPLETAPVIEEDVPLSKPNIWPLQKDVMKYYGAVGTNQTTLTFPYKMRIAWNTDQFITKTSCHEKVHDSLKRIFVGILNEYSYPQIQEMGLDLFGGCLNVRKMRGGSSYSMHSWGIAVDFDPTRNQLKWGRDKANMAKPEFDKFWKIVKGENWIGLGPEKNMDWQHIQAARFR